ncbi:MAG: hypothetical protein L0J69_05170, partial [Yaniella sp.]|nr:hypothetical protein [Yaniella sp.]
MRAITGYSFGFGDDGGAGGGVVFVGGAGGAGDAERAVPGVGCAGAFGVGVGAVSCAAPAWASACPPTADPAL